MKFKGDNSMINQLITFTTKLDIAGFDIYNDNGRINIEYNGPETGFAWKLIALSDTYEEAKKYMYEISENKIPVQADRMNLIGLPENNSSDYYDTHDRPQE